MYKLKLSFFALLLSVVLLIPGCGKDSVSPEEIFVPEFLVSTEPVTVVTAAEIRERYPLAAAMVNQDVAVLKVVYNTKMGETSLRASGLVLLPNHPQTNLTILSFQHGTIATQDEAPSAYKPVGNMEAYVAGTLGASLAKGYMVVMPDYIGYGESSEVSHPYQEKASLATACLDMLKAVKELAYVNQININKGIRLLGYSEGGYATLALHQAIEQESNVDFNVEASYPAAGAYDMVGTAQWVVNQTSTLPSPATSFYMWTLLTYNQLYGINMPLESVLQPEYVVAVQQALAAGNPMSAQVSDNPSELFAPSFIAGITEGSNTPFLAALQQNNVYDWKPNAPVTLYHSEGDHIVPFLNATNAKAAMEARGATVNIISLGDLEHQAASAAYIQAVLPQLLQ
ncbi:alpha/beta hydrolase [Olivibacter sitiensis]|uniref:alpha/beta hydrolase n=1 Tax=Olivibacter sitiensis TaxID=376470 RepID=UPI00068508AA|nr:alpha/beta fold hydrolase [Olivibacter sitiensis]